MVVKVRIFGMRQLVNRMDANVIEVECPPDGSLRRGPSALGPLRHRTRNGCGLA